MKLSTLENKENCIDDFLKCDDFIKKHAEIIQQYDQLFYIYKITNKKTNKIYIGKTKDIRRRASEYLSEYYFKRGKKRVIWLAMQKDGIENFIMEPIDLTSDKKLAADKEIYYINETHSYDPDVGYNQVIQSIISKDYIQNSKPRYQQAEEKMRRSKLIAALNPTTKEVIFSTGLKLFGDYINRGKDEIKSAAKRSSSMNGYYIYYLSQEEFSKQIEYAEIYSKKERLHVNYDEFFHLAKLLVDILIQNSNDENYSIKFIHQSDDSETGYVFNDPEIILKYYNSLVKDCKVKAISYSHHDN